jgi:hypothetical protein
VTEAPVILPFFKLLFIEGSTRQHQNNVTKLYVQINDIFSYHGFCLKIDIILHSFYLNGQIALTAYNFGIEI